MKLDAALATFEEEARELLEDMEQRLLTMESGDADPDTINALFRAAHTIKGSGGLFGLDALVGFTHHVESLIDLMREGSCAVTADLVGLLLRCGDHMAFLLAEALGKASSGADAVRREAELVASLEQSRRLATGAAVAASHGLAPAAKHAEPEHGPWTVHVRFATEVFRNGLDPLSFIRYLGTLGNITSIATSAPALPAFDAFDAEVCHLECAVIIEGELDRASIESAFDFVRNDCILLIRAASAEPAAGAALMSATPAGAAQPDVAAQDGSAADLASGKATAAQAQAPITAVPPIAAPDSPLPEVARSRAEPRAGESRFLRVEADKLDHLINLIGELVIAGASCNVIANKVRSADMIEATSAVNALVESIRDTALNLRMVQIGATFSRFQRVVRDLSQELGKDIALHISGSETELDKSVVEKIGDPLMHLVRNALDHGIENREARRAAGKSETGTLQLHAYHESGSIVIEVADDGGGLNVDRIRAKAIERGIINDASMLSEREIHALIFEPGFSTAAAVTNVSGRGVGMDVVRRNIESLRGTVEVESRLGIGTTMRIRLPLTLAIIEGFLVDVGGDAFVIPLSMVVECLELRATDVAAGGDRNYVNLRGEVMPFMRLRELFDKKSACSKRENIVVVRYAGHSAGLVVDALLGDFQTVIKPLGRLFGAVRGISGSTILGSGEVALILDVPSLIQLATEREIHEPARTHGIGIHRP